MGKQEYLDALKRVLRGLPPELQARTLAWYEQRFVDGMGAGRLEADIARELGDPKKVALTLSANTHMHAFTAQKSPASAARMLVSVLGLLIFNLFMLIPAAVVAAMLASLYIAAFSFYAGGIAVTASGLSGADELVFDGPLRQLIGRGGRDGVVTHVSIGETGIQVQQERSGQAPAAASGPVVGIGSGSGSGGAIRISTDTDEDARATQTVLGLSSVLGGIVLFLVSLVLTRHAALGLKRYVQMNLSLARGA